MSLGLFYFGPRGNMFYLTLGSVKFGHVKVGCVFICWIAFVFVNLEKMEKRIRICFIYIFSPEWFVTPLAEKRWDFVQEGRGDKIRGFPWRDEWWSQLEMILSIFCSDSHSFWSYILEHGGGVSQIVGLNFGCICTSSSLKCGFPIPFSKELTVSEQR